MAFKEAKVDEDVLRRRIADAVKAVELSETSAWADLDILSTHTRVEGIDVEPDGVIFEPDHHFRGVVNIYVSLQYGSDGDDGFTSSESFLGEFSGELDANSVPHVGDITVDTTEFYE